MVMTPQCTHKSLLFSITVKVHICVEKMEITHYWLSLIFRQLLLSFSPPVKVVLLLKMLCAAC